MEEAAKNHLRGTAMAEIYSQRWCGEPQVERKLHKSMHFQQMDNMLDGGITKICRLDVGF